VCSDKPREKKKRSQSSAAFAAATVGVWRERRKDGRVGKSIPSLLFSSSHGAPKRVPVGKGGLRVLDAPVASTTHPFDDSLPPPPPNLLFSFLCFSHPIYPPARFHARTCDYVCVYDSGYACGVGEWFLWGVQLMLERTAQRRRGPLPPLSCTNQTRVFCLFVCAVASTGAVASSASSSVKRKKRKLETTTAALRGLSPLPPFLAFSIVCVCVCYSYYSSLLFRGVVVEQHACSTVVDESRHTRPLNPLLTHFFFCSFLRLRCTCHYVLRRADAIFRLAVMY
jgi:hypothetical protein